MNIISSKYIITLILLVIFSSCENETETYYSSLRKNSKTDGEYLWKANCGQCHHKSGLSSSLTDIRKKEFEREWLQKFIINDSTLFNNEDTTADIADSTFFNTFWPHEYTFSNKQKENIISHILNKKK